MNCIERFRQRQNIAMTLEVPWGEFILTVARLPREEHNAALRKAEGLLRDTGQDPDTASSQHKFVWFCCALAEYLKRHVKGWVHNPAEGDALPFSAQTFDEVYRETDDSERVNLGMSYILIAEANTTTAAEDKKKADSPPKSSVEISKKRSNGVLLTTSETAS